VRVSLEYIRIALSQAGDEGAFTTLGRATTASSMGGGSKGVRSTTGKWSFLVCTSSVCLTDRGILTDRAARTVDFKVVVIANTELRVWLALTYCYCYLFRGHTMIDL